jgi:transcriptional regulator with XRE-family HTH domain
MSQLGERIRQLRFDREMRVKDLAERVGISNQSLMAIERGRVDNPNFNTVANIASVLSVSLDYLHRGSPGFMEKEVETLREHADLLRGLHDVLGVIVTKLG